jgi:hypothetical protein
MKDLIEEVSCEAFQHKHPLDDNQADGRLGSAIAEGPHLDKMKESFDLKMSRYHLRVNIAFEIAPPREWYDLKVGPFHINLKLTKGGTDNVFNKRAIVLTVCGVLDGVPKVMNINQMLGHIHRLGVKKIRDIQTEYYYLVVNKQTGESMFKSIIDIHTYVPNSSNTLQINWKHEFIKRDYVCESYEDKIDDLMMTIKTSAEQVRLRSDSILGFNGFQW